MIKLEENHCCENCFINKDIKSFIRKNGVIGTCEYCDSKDVYVILTGKIGAFLRECIDKAYEDVDAGSGAMYDSETKEYLGGGGQAAIQYSVKDILEGESAFDFIPDNHLVEDIFADSGPSSREIQHGAFDPYGDVDSEQFVLQNDLFGVFDIQAYSAWETFKFSVKHYNRFFDVDAGQKSVDIRKVLLEGIRHLLCDYERTIMQGEIFYRVREKKKLDFDSLKIDKELSPAPASKPQINRMSPAGISYLYVCSDPETACKETRCNNTDVIVAKYIALQELSILDFSESIIVGADSIFSENYDHDTRWHNEFLRRFAEEISKPVDQGWDAMKSYEYAPTQVIAEYIRSLGFDGIGFRSSVNNGKSYCFFCGPETSFFIREYGLYEDQVPYQILPSFLDFFKIDSISLCHTSEKGVIEKTLQTRANLTSNAPNSESY